MATVVGGLLLAAVTEGDNVAFAVILVAAAWAVGRFTHLWNPWIAAAVAAGTLIVYELVT